MTRGEAVRLAKALPPAAGPPRCHAPHHRRGVRPPTASLGPGDCWAHARLAPRRAAPCAWCWPMARGAPAWPGLGTPGQRSHQAARRGV